jgi:hypothetical protein
MRHSPGLRIRGKGRRAMIVMALRAVLCGADT